ncbi:MAG: kelch repeat-containing protein [Tepidisphaeraceae bacterium]
MQAKRIRSTPSQPLENLESRRLMSAASSPVEVAGGLVAGVVGPYEFAAAAPADPRFAVKINFQSESSPTVPAGYRADIGRTYGRRKNGLTYGWHGSNEFNAIDRNSPNSPDARFDDFNQFVGPQAWWSIAVPNGRYRVHLMTGDPDDLNSYQKLNVEGRRIVDGAPSADQPFIEGTVEVIVSDGKIDITGAAGGLNNKVSYIEIAQIDTLQVNWSDAEVPARISRVEPGSIQIGNKLYVFGGYRKGDLSVTRSVDVLDFETMAWTQLAPIPKGAAESHAGIATDGTYIYWAGGQLGGEENLANLQATTAVWRYEIATNIWSRYIDLPDVRYAPAMVYLDGILYVSGGDDASRTDPTTTHWALDTRSASPAWANRAPLPKAGDHKGSAVVNGQIYAIGGEHGHGTTYVQHDEVFAYDPATDTWTQKASMPWGSSHFEGATLVIGTKILVMGGRVDFPYERTARVRVYDTVTDAWTSLNPLPFDRLGGTAGIFNGRVYFTNGYSSVQGIAGEAFWGDLIGFGV